MKALERLRFGVPMFGSKHWHGGILYTVNLVKALRCQENQRPIVIAVITPEQAPHIPENWEFIELCDQIALVGDFSRFEVTAPATIPILKFATLCDAQSAIDFVFPTISHVQNEIANASWIPDFQHHHLPEFFSQEELDTRTKAFSSIAAHARLLVLSSEDAKRDFKQFYPNATVKTTVLHFCSQLAIPEGDPRELLKPLEIADKFLLCCNQFWTHKDHRTLFLALGALKNRGLPIHLVCTGAASDYRNQHHYASLLKLIQELGLQSHVKLLGYVPREQQIALIRCCVAMVQPSLFEGWSTVLEDARCLGVRMIASDLNVHKEQNLPDALYFERRNPAALAYLLFQHFASLPPGPNVAREQMAQALAQKQLFQYGQDLIRLADMGKALFPHVSEGAMSVQEISREVDRLFIAVRANPQDLPSFLELARNFWALGLHDKAMELFRALVQQSPLDETLVNALAEHTGKYANLKKVTG